MLGAITVLFTILLIHSSSSTATENINEYGSVYKPFHLQISELQQKADTLGKYRQQLNRDVVDQLSNIRSEHILNAAKTANVTGPCQDAFDQLIIEISETWVLKVFDSWGKIGDGIFSGRTKFPGDFDECKNVSGTIFKTDNDTFVSKYCTVTLPIIPQLITAQLGVCLPKQCSSTDLITFYNNLLSEVLKIPNVHLAASAAQCQEQDHSLGNGRMVALVFVLLMIIVCALATLYEGIFQLIGPIIQQRKSWLLNEKSESTPLLSGSPQQVPQPGLIMKTILSFSFYSNIGKIMNTEQPPGAINCLNGIRFFSMTWVILGHTIMIMSFSVLDNPLFVLDLYKRFATQAIINATVSVDTFFILSGLLVSYLFLKDFHKRKIQLKGFLKALPVIYLHRYLRLTPAYAFMILIHTALLWYVWDGPYWPNNVEPPFHTLDANCVNNWYLNILYVNNLFQEQKQCVAWGWYLANDTQFFLIAPFIVFLFYLHFKIGIAVCIATILGSNIAAVVVSNQQHTSFAISPLAHNNFTKVDDIKLGYYNVPWSRYQTYGIGLLTGALIYKFKQMDFKIPAVVNLILWGISAALCMSAVYGPYDANMGYHVVHLPEVDLYNGFARSAWALGVSYVMISCSLGQGGWVNEFLSWRGFVPLSRLTYCAYLIHIPCILLIYCGAREGTYYTTLTIAQDVILTITVAYFVAFAFSLVFEMPFINLDKLYLTPKSIKKERHEEQRNKT